MAGDTILLGGIKVLIGPVYPKMQLSAEVCRILPPEFIKEMNEWMIDFFGMQSIVPDGEIWLSNGAAVMSRATLQHLQQGEAK